MSYKPASAPRAITILSPEDKEMLTLLGRSIRGYRIQAAMPRKELADRLLLSEPTITRIEAGDPRVAMGYYLAACRAVGMKLLDPAALIGEMSNFDPGRKRASKLVNLDDRFK